MCVTYSPNVKPPKPYSRYPKHYFLDPKNKKFPYKSRNGCISIKLLRSALLLAGMHAKRHRGAKRKYYESIKRKARRLLEKYRR